MKKPSTESPTESTSKTVTPRQLPKGITLAPASKLIKEAEELDKSDAEMEVFLKKVGSEITQLKATIDPRNESMVSTLKMKSDQLDTVPFILKRNEERRVQLATLVDQTCEPLFEALGILTAQELEVITDERRAILLPILKSEEKVRIVVGGTEEYQMLTHIYHGLIAKSKLQVSVAERLEPLVTALQRYLDTGTLIQKQT